MIACDILVMDPPSVPVDAPLSAALEQLGLPNVRVIDRGLILRGLLTEGARRGLSMIQSAPGMPPCDSAL